MLHLEKARAKRSLQDALKTFETVFMEHNLLCPHFPDHVEIAVAPPLRNAFEAPTDDTLLRTVSKDVLHDAIKTWEEETSLKVLQLMRDSLKNPSLERKDLYLAAAVFFCKRCQGFLHYPEVSTHSCAFDGDKMERFRALWKLVKSGIMRLVGMTIDKFYFENRITKLWLTCWGGSFARTTEMLRRMRWMKKIFWYNVSIAGRHRLRSLRRSGTLFLGSTRFVFLLNCFD